MGRIKALAIPVLSSALISTALAVSVNYATSGSASPWTWFAAAALTILSAFATLWIARDDEDKQTHSQSVTGSTIRNNVQIGGAQDVDVDVDVDNA